MHEQLAVRRSAGGCARGCVLLKLGLESGNQAVLDAVAKGIRLELMERTLAALSRAGIATYVYLLFGTPSESLVEARQTLDFTRRHHKAITFLNLAVFNMPVASDEAAELPGTRFSDGDPVALPRFRPPARLGPAGGAHPSSTASSSGSPRSRPSSAATRCCSTSNHAAFFAGHFPVLDGEGIKA